MPHRQLLPPEVMLPGLSRESRVCLEDERGWCPGSDVESSWLPIVKLLARPQRRKLVLKNLGKLGRPCHQPIRFDGICPWSKLQILVASEFESCSSGSNLRAVLARSPEDQHSRSRVSGHCICLLTGCLIMFSSAPCCFYPQSCRRV